MSLIHLINGRGQLGRAMRTHLADKNFYSDLKKTLISDVYIYHTWIFEDKSEKTQKTEYKKFESYVKINNEKYIIFTSTYSEKDNWYNHYKHHAESFLLNNCKKCLIIRIPTIIGKGICQKIKDDEVQAFGKLYLTTLDNAAKKVLELSTYSGLSKYKTIKGQFVDAKIVEALYNI